MTLLGPADADHYRVKVGRYGDRFYADPLPKCSIADVTDAHWPSVTTIKNASTTDWTYIGLKRAAEAIHRRPADIEGLTLPELYERLKSYNKTGLGAAADRGTTVHGYMERALRGESIAAWEGEPGHEYAGAVKAFIDAYRPQLVAAELVTINRTLNGVGYGGTLDAIVRIDGKTYIVDWKSRGADSQHGAYPAEAVQIAGYATAEYAIAEGPRRIPIPHLDGGLIVSIKPDGFRVYPVDLADAAQHWRALHTWWVARRSETDAIGKPWAPVDTTDVEPAPVPTPDPAPYYGGAADAILAEIQACDTVDALEGLYYDRIALWGDRHTAAAAQRKEQIARGVA